MEEGIKKHIPLHKDLAKTMMKRDTEGIGLVLKWLEEYSPFDLDQDKQLLISFSTGSTSTADDEVNAERAAAVGREMQINLDGKSVISMKFKVQPLSSLKVPKVNDRKLHINSLKLFNQLLIISQRDMTVETSLKYELTPVPLSFFSNKDQKMNKANKTTFATLALRR